MNTSSTHVFVSGGRRAMNELAADKVIGASQSEPYILSVPVLKSLIMWTDLFNRYSDGS